jgi:hypothetical protein
VSGSGAEGWGIEAAFVAIFFGILRTSLSPSLGFGVEGG